VNNAQLFLSIGAPRLFNAIAFTWINSRFATMEGRMTNLESSINIKLDLIIGKLHELGTRITRLEEHRR
jgi:hypothetical protein